MKSFSVITIFMFLVGPVFVSAEEPLPKICAFFSSVDKLDARLIQQIDLETQKIHLAVYQFTHQGIADALIRAYKRGVEVEVVVDSFSVRKRSPLLKMAKENISIFVWDPLSKENSSIPRKKKPRALMHHKFCILGDSSVWTGSYNFTKVSSDSHCENAVVFEDADLADLYEKEFSILKTSGSVLYSEYLSLIEPSRKIK